MPNSVDGSVPARVIIEVRSSGSGSSPPWLTSSCCIIIWPRAADSAGEALRLGADALVVDADRPGDGVLGGQQDRRIGGDPVAQADGVRGDLVQQRLATLEHARDALADIRRDVRVGEPALQFRAAGVESAIAAWVSPPVELASIAPLRAAM